MAFQVSAVLRWYSILLPEKRSFRELFSELLSAERARAQPCSHSVANKAFWSRFGNFAQVFRARSVCGDANSLTFPFKVLKSTMFPRMSGTTRLWKSFGNFGCVAFACCAAVLAPHPMAPSQLGPIHPIYSHQKHLIMMSSR
jgi:hypothetical protein